MKKKYEVVVIAGCLLLLATLLVAFGLIKKAAIANKLNWVETYQKSNFTKRTGQLATQSDIDNARDRNCFNYNYIQIEADLAKVDPISESFGLRLRFTPCGDFGVRKLGMAQTAGIPLSKPVNITFDSFHMAFDAGKVMGGNETKVEFALGDYNEYPFDRYQSSVVYVSGLYSPNKSEVADDDPDLVLLPLAVKVSGTVQSWMTEFNQIDDFSYGPNSKRIFDGTLVGFQVTTQRSVFSLFFSILVQLMMWILPSLVAIIATRNLMSGKPPEGPAVGLSMSLLFTLPNVRATQPGVPPIGCTADAVSFLPSLLICSFGVCLLLYNLNRSFY
ncbi:hypothetical protein DFJ73DRAFT_809451 [Zopfochytrium polystomum]|nr:hypothetical protein DFJ73DRAFT_809451 [Zopfochytrium polystomum]